MPLCIRDDEVRNLAARLARLDALPRRAFDDDDMYDDLGLPK